MSDKFKGELFEFVHKIIPDINSSMFQTVKSYHNGHLYNSILLPKSTYYFPYMGYKGLSLSDDYYERHFYTIKITSDGFYDVIWITQQYSRFNKYEPIITILEVTCKEFYKNFNRITKDLRLLLKDPPQIEKEPEISQSDYCNWSISLMKNS